VTLLVALKALHILALAIWCGALLAIPTLFRQRSHSGDGEARHDLYRMTRGVFVGLASPAAAIAVGAGTALVFVAGVFTPWMFLKLAAVGALVGLHVRTGIVLLQLFRRGRTYPRWRQLGATVTTTGVLTIILLLVLAKPRLGVDFLPRWMVEPGGLQSFSSTMMPTP
jgi:putative membrane protein